MTDTPKAEAPPAAAAATVLVDHYTQLTRFIVKRIGSRQDADDLVQEIFEQFVRAERAHPTEVIRDPLKYIYGIAAHVVSDHLRHAGQRRRSLIVDSEVIESLNDKLPAEHSDYLAERLSEERSLQRALAGLPTTHRQVLVLTARDRLSHAEVAIRLDISLDTVKKYAHQARALLRLRWKRDGGE